MQRIQLKALAFLLVTSFLCWQADSAWAARSLPSSKKYVVDPVNDLFTAWRPNGKPLRCAVIGSKQLVIAGNLKKGRQFIRLYHAKIVRMRKELRTTTFPEKRKTIKRRLRAIGAKRDGLDALCFTELYDKGSSSSSSSSGDLQCKDPGSYPGAYEHCDLYDNDCDGEVDEGCCPGGPYQGSEKLGYCPDDFFGMQIESARGNAAQAVIETSGARYVISQDEIEMWRLIDPATNSVNPRLVGKLLFPGKLGALNIEYSHKRAAVVSSPKALFTFNSDSFFFVEAKEALTYTHLNLIDSAPWNRGSGMNRMWTDGLGGSLHANVRNAPAWSGEADSTTFNMQPGQRAAHMVFPPKPFDFEGLYGESARPFVASLSATLKSMPPFIADPARFDPYLTDGFGTFLLWNQMYVTGDDGPMLLESGLMGYQMRGDIEPTVRSFIKAAHQKGIKILFYIYTPSTWKYPAGHPKAGQVQEMELTLQWMREFKENYGIDGWYLDNGNAGDLMEDYDFMRQLRSDVGREGIIYHHDSVDVWGGYSGLRAIMVNAYVNHTLTGETGLEAKVDEPNNPYFRFFSAGYGMSQSYSAHKRRSRMDIAMSEQEKNRVMTYNLHGVERGGRSAAWLSHVKPFYLARKSQYLAGTLQMAPAWPLDPQTGWFRAPANINLEWLSGTSLKISWETEQEADSELACTSNGVWWDSQYEQDGPEQIVQHSAFGKQHSLILRYLKPNTDYQYRIRSNNRAPGVEEIIWGQVRTFRTASADADGDGMADDWELEHFGTLSRTGFGDYDGDQLSDLNEYLNGTNPRLPDTDFDGFSDYIEIQNRTDPLDWNVPPVACNHNLVCQDGISGETALNCHSDCHADLVGRWLFEHGQAWDASGNRNHAVVHGALWTSEPETGRGGVFELVGDWFPDYLELPAALASPAVFGGSHGKITIAGWVKVADELEYNVMAFNIGGVYYFSAGSSGFKGRLVCMVRDVVNDKNHWPVSNGTINAGEWTHVAFVLEGGTGYRFYINGQLDKQEMNSNLTLYDYELSSAPGLGRGVSETSYFTGRLDDISVWKKALSHQEVCQVAGFVWNSGVCIN